MTRYGSFHIMTSCGQCGQPVPVNGPLLTVECGHCFGPRSLVPDTFEDIMNSLEDEYHSFDEGQGQGVKSMGGHGTFKYTYLRRRPQCAKCKSPLAVDDIAVGAEVAAKCADCGTGFKSFPAPDWLRKVVPSAVQCYGADAPASSTGVELEIDQSIPKAIAMACPACAAGLQVTGDWQRTHPCEFCKTEVFIPDALWKRLHPVATARHWGVRFEGQTAKQVAGEHKRERAQESAVAAATLSAQSSGDVATMCVYAIEMASKNNFDPGAVQLAMFDIKKALRGRWGGSRLAEQVGKLLAAENDKRAMKLVLHAGQLWRTSTIVLVVAAIAVAVGVGVFASL